MTMGPSPEFLRRQLQLADEALADARLLLEHHRHSAASNRSYYAMFYAAMAALSLVSSRLPKSHRGTISLFGRHYVQSGKMDRQFAIDLRTAYNLRLQGDYGTSPELGSEQVQEVVDKAQAFISEVKRLVNEE